MKKYKYKYLCEGESEQKFIKVLKENNLLISAKVEVFNISNKDIKSIIRKCTRGDFWIFIVDIDVFNSDLFCKNIKLLHKNRCKFCIIFQNKNLEDEIIRCCDVSNEIDLFRKFYTVTSATEFKNRLIKDNSLYSKLKGIISI